MHKAHLLREKEGSPRYHSTWKICWILEEGGQFHNRPPEQCFYTCLIPLPLNDPFLFAKQIKYQNFVFQRYFITIIIPLFVLFVGPLASQLQSLNAYEQPYVVHHYTMRLQRYANDHPSALIRGHRALREQHGWR